MALADFEVFVRERVASWDGSIDASPGSPFDNEVIQPILRRIGTDPFTIDAAVFIMTRLAQEYPDLAVGDGDALTDALVKPALLMLDPIIREIKLVKSQKSFSDPAVLTKDDTDALAANIFATRPKGDFARGVARLYFPRPTKCSVSALNIFTSRSGLVFTPTKTQSIRLDEMALNVEGDSYYFDVNLVANEVGTDYNIDATELVFVANLPGVARVTNKFRFRDGVDEPDNETFIQQVDQSLGDRSLVTVRGISATLKERYPSMNHSAVSGMGDPEMKRDVLTGGSLGPIVTYGLDGRPVGDGESKLRTRRYHSDTANFLTSIGPIGAVRGFVLTALGSFATAPYIRDMTITKVISATDIEVEEQVLDLHMGPSAWTIRKKSIEITGIGGGIIAPSILSTSLSVDPLTVHVGGCTDVHVGGETLSKGSVVIDVLADDTPAAKGLYLSIAPGGGGVVVLEDFTFQVGPIPEKIYNLGDPLYTAFSNAVPKQFTLEILEGTAAGVYRIIAGVIEVIGGNPNFYVDPPPVVIPGRYRWRMVDDIDLDLVEPKQERIRANDGLSVLNVTTFQTVGGTTDFGALGVSVGDILRIDNGRVIGDYTVREVVAPLFNSVKVDRPFKFSETGLTYSIFRPNTGGGVARPFVRVSSIELLDSAGQPVGTTIPYGRVVDVQSRSFQNSGNGLKEEFFDLILGIVSKATPTLGWDFGAAPINLTFSADDVATFSVDVSSASPLSSITLASIINAASSASVGWQVASVVTEGSDTYVVIAPFGRHATVAGPAGPTFFDSSFPRTSRDIRTTSGYVWSSLAPSLDYNYDVLQLLDGVQIQFLNNLVISTSDSGTLKANVDLAPEIKRHGLIGSRSIGSARCYFLDPVSAEFGPNSIFTFVDTDGVELSYKPDPLSVAIRLPSQPNGGKPTTGQAGLALDGITPEPRRFSDPFVDFLSTGVQVGDLLKVDFMPMTGSVTLADPVVGLAGKELIVSLDGGYNKSIIFVSDSSTPGALTRQGVFRQINAAVGAPIAGIVEGPAGSFFLQFNPDVSVIIRKNSSAAQANTLLGFSSTADTSNKSPNKGLYVIDGIFGTNTLVCTPNFAFPMVAQQYSIVRQGTQRKSSTKMAEIVGETGLYFMDVELVSLGTGDLYNIGANQTMTCTGYDAEGYWLEATDTNLTFSVAERCRIHFSDTILEVGVDDHPDNAIKLAGQAVSVNYEYSPTTESIQSLLLSEEERTICASPLARHLLPHFIRLSLKYQGGSNASVILEDVEKYIRTIQANQRLESSDLTAIMTKRGATSVTHPIDLIAVVHNQDRTVSIARSQDGITTTRLATFIPDVINVDRSLV